jgi:hypothetical protein
VFPLGASLTNIPAGDTFAKKDVAADLSPAPAAGGAHRTLSAAGSAVVRQGSAVMAAVVRGGQLAFSSRSAFPAAWSDPIDEEILVVCGPCKCRSYGSSKYREFIVTKLSPYYDR